MAENRNNDRHNFSVLSNIINRNQEDIDKAKIYFMGYN